MKRIVDRSVGHGGMELEEEMAEKSSIPLQRASLEKVAPVQQ